MLKAIEPHLTEEKTLFDTLNAKLNRIIQEDGTEADTRLEPVKAIESTVERFVQDSFKTVKLRIAIPPPELKTVLSSALIYADDGVDGPIDTKGDGLRRAVVFAILRAYVELSKSGLLSDEANNTHLANNSSYLLLFEEPELYLHPKAQQILFDALGAFSQKHPVFVTTHSPTFFGPQSTTSFIKMCKKMDVSIAPKPFGKAHAIDLNNTNAKDQFQIICYENNNIAFFADRAILVEGDSDYIIFPQLTRLIYQDWNSAESPAQFSRIGGKANIRKYRDFFKRFNIKVFVITDLDFILGNEFNQIDPPADIVEQRNQLLATVDTILEANGGIPEPNSGQIKAAQERGDLRALWRRARELHAEFKAERISWDTVEATIDDFFAWERYWARRDLLKQSSDELLLQKRVLLASLRTLGICVLEKGSIEDYYPENITLRSKPEMAQELCKMITNREQALALCSSNYSGTEANQLSEFEVIFQTVLH